MPQRRRLSTQQMEAFRAVMLAGSVNGAARELGISQPSLTRMLRRIEDVVGFALFEAVKGRLFPTLEARLLLASLQHIREQLEALDDAIERIGQRGRGLFRLGASPSVGRQLVPAALAGFRRRFPEAPIRFDTIQIPNVVDYLALGRGECFLSVVPIDHPTVECRAIWPGRLVCTLPAGHPLAARASLVPADLVGEPLIAGDPETHYGEMVRELFRGIGQEADIRVVVQVAETAIGMTGHGLGVAVMDEFTAMDAASDRVAVRPLAVGPRYHVHLNRNRDVARSRYVLALEEELLALLRARETSEVHQPGIACLDRPRR